VILRYFEDRSEAEAAQILGCRVGTVKSHLSRAVAKLRTRLPDLIDVDAQGVSR
jgi:DNA-directed RNA polymerase specialized sigma24 family protein